MLAPAPSVAATPGSLLANPDDRWAIEDLVGPFGVVSEPRPMDTRGWLPPGMSVYLTSVGDLAWLRGAEVPLYLGGAGRTVADPALARRIAVCEGVERYANLFPRPMTEIWATGRDLGDEGLPLEEVARCSSAELRRPGLDFVLPDPKAMIRWTEGIELTRNEPCLIPLMMARMVPPMTRAEVFWLPMSTGCAIQRNPVTALISGLYEVVERDAVSVAWLRKLPLPRLDPAALARQTLEVLSWYRDREVTVHLFDATTDVPVPTVLAVVDAPHDRRVSQCIGSAAGFDVGAAALKAVLEATGLYAALAERTSLPRRYRDFSDPLASAAYMGRASRRPVFAFLLEGARPTSRPAGRTFRSAEHELGHVLGLLRAGGMAAYGVDLTPREVAGVGYAVTQVLVPALQPASLHPLIQYRAHARLRHDHPAADGVQRVRDLNQWPLPLS